VGVAVLAGVVVVGIAGAVLWKLAEAPPPAEPVVLTPEPPPAPATWTVQSVPTGAEVYSGEERLGVAPLQVSIGKGHEVLSLRLAGYEPGEARRSPDLGDQVSLVELKPLPAPPPEKPKGASTGAAKKPPRKGGDDILLQR
jgi:hypothetical protein